MRARQTLKGESLFGREQINGYDAHAAVTFSCVASYVLCIQHSSCLFDNEDCDSLL